MATCKICLGNSATYDQKLVLDQYQVTYFKCGTCGFIQTEEPYWLEQAYGNAITSLDIGLIYRNEHNAPIVGTVIKRLFDSHRSFIDYGGGYGLLVRMMRDRGFDFYRQDKFCENLFAKDFDYEDAPVKRFELLTAFEVLEHLVDPVAELKEMAKLSDNFLFSTELQPESSQALADWWYFTPETGQHVSLYTSRALQVLAEQFGMHLLSFHDLHLFTRDKKSKMVYQLCFNNKFRQLTNRFNKMPSLLHSDVGIVKAKAKQVR
jgi:hypothetical protein